MLRTPRRIGQILVKTLGVGTGVGVMAETEGFLLLVGTGVTILVGFLVGDKDGVGMGVGVGVGGRS